MYQVRVRKMQRMARRNAEALAVTREPAPPSEPLPDRFRDIDGVPTPRACKGCGRMFATKSGLVRHMAGYHQPRQRARAA